MIRNPWLAAVVVALAPIPCLGQFGGMGGVGGGMGGMQQMPRGTEEWSVKIETFGSNQAVTGKLHVLSVMVQCDVGTYEIKPGKVKSIQFAAPVPADQVTYNQFGWLQREGAVVTSTDEKVGGVVTVPSWWRVETDLGTLTPDGSRLKSITFLSKVEPVQQPAVVKPGGGPQEGRGGRGGDKPGGQPIPPSPADPNKPKGGQPGAEPEQKP